MKKAIAILISGFMLLTALSISASAALRQPAQQHQIIMGTATVTITLYYGDGETLCDNATIILSKNDGTWHSELHTDEDGGPVTFGGVPGGLFTLEAYRPHPQYGKQVGILLWGKVYDNNFVIEDGETYDLVKILEGGLFKSVSMQLQPSQPANL